MSYLTLDARPHHSDFEGLSMNNDEQVASVDLESVKTEWLNRLNILANDVKTWAEASGWRTRIVSKTLTERPLGSYKVPLLLMEKEAVEAVLNPVARYTPGADGAVDLYLAPAYDDIASLYFADGRWVVNHPFPVDQRGDHLPDEATTSALTEETIRKLLDEMIAHA